MLNRIRKILMICSNYDAFTLEEDGRIEIQVTEEYRELNLSNPPKFIWANSSAEARKILDSDKEVDMIMCMYNERDKAVFSFASEIRSAGSTIPFIMLIHYSRAVRQRIFEYDQSGIPGTSELYFALQIGSASMLCSPQGILSIYSIRKSSRHRWVPYSG